jgi:transposase
MRSRCGTPRRAFRCDCAGCAVAPHLVWADGGYTGGLVDWCRQKLALTLEIVKRTDDTEGFVIRPRRWVAEPAFAWLMNSRRVVRDYGTLPATGEAMITTSASTPYAQPRSHACLMRLPRRPQRSGPAPPHELGRAAQGRRTSSVMNCGPVSRR